MNPCHRSLFPLLLALSHVCIAETTPCEGMASHGQVRIMHHGRYHVVTIAPGSPQEIGTHYAKALKALPWAKHVDSQVSEVVKLFAKNTGATEAQVYGMLTKRVQDLLPSLQEDHRTELLVLAETAADAPQSVAGDGKVSKEEILIANFFPEVCCKTACSAVSVFGPLSHTGSNIVGRVLDWPQGANGSLNHLNAITLRKTQKMTTLSVGFLGFLPVLTGLNSQGIYVALFNSNHNEPLHTVGKRSFTFDLRTALEQSSHLQEVTHHLLHPTCVYPYPFNSIVADLEQTVAIENASPAGKHGADIRTSVSPLHDGVTWGHEYALGMVNSNLLKNHYNNHTAYAYNTERWKVICNKLSHPPQEKSIGVDTIKGIILHHAHPDKIGSEQENIYNLNTQHMTLWDSVNHHFQAWFRAPGETLPPLNPVFETIPLPWPAPLTQP